MTKLKRAGVILAAALTTAILYGCPGGDVAEPGTFDGLDAKTEWQIVQDYYDAYIKGENGLTASDIQLNGYYGAYHGVTVVSIEGPWDTPPFQSLFYHGFSQNDDNKYNNHKFSVFSLSDGHVLFCYPSEINLLFYKDRSFINTTVTLFNIEDFLSFSDLKSIAARVNSTEIFGRFEGLYEGLDEETEMRIIHDFNRKHYPEKTPFAVYDSYVNYYFGTFDGCVVLTLKGQYTYVYLPQYKFSIEGIDFIFRDPEEVNNPDLVIMPPIVWKDGQIYDGIENYPYINSGLGLREAYDLQLLTLDDLSVIADRLSAVLYE